MVLVRFTFRLSYDSEDLFTERNHLRIASPSKGAQCLKVVDGFEKIGLTLSVVTDQRYSFARHLQFLILEISEVPY